MCNTSLLKNLMGVKINMLSWLKPKVAKVKETLETQLHEANKKIEEYSQTFSQITELSSQLNNITLSLKKSERLFRTLSELTPTFILIIDNNKNIVYSNQKIDNIVGYTNLDCPLSFEMILNYLDNTDKDILLNIIEDYFKTQNPTPKEFIIKLKWNNSNIEKTIKLFIQFMNFENDLCILLNGVDISDEINIFNDLKLS